MKQMTVNRDDSSPKEHLAGLDEIFAESPYPMRLLGDSPGPFRTCMRTLDLGTVNVVELTLPSSEVLRTSALVRRSDPELCSVIFPVQGRLLLSQADRQAVLGAHDFALYDSSLPFRLKIAIDGEPAKLVRAHLPRALVGMPAAAMGRLLARPLPGRTGVGGLLVRYLADLAANAADYRPADLPRLDAIAHDLLAAAVAHHLDAEPASSNDAHRQGLLLRIEAFIRQHLRDPDLSPEMIAVAHHISLGHLHRLFGARDTTVAVWIRRQRLERARRDLRNPDLQAVPVHRIAVHWGFRDHSTFTRAFRAAYGVPPKEYRHGARTGAG
ncbi:helix-turn-helix domain-containing protein [Actinomadura verrucosospora]|uniref:AraC family transcriptional regulator n=1 Tax=Actinomadura verrucosospora TaxID=46165 RepID=A0A7D4ALQ2_ACTVE|nr:helix-turn-helix domain-containing protein [Actinomadura verrucosospora]QKG21568.1 AraC family transcriptional regulator [Actinomadura verrucosospora]